MILTVHLHPAAKRNAIEWIDDDTLKAWVTAAPERGKANDALLELLAADLHVAKSLVRIVRGATTRLKHIEIPTNSA